VTDDRSAQLLGTNSVARLLGVHPKHVYRLLKRGMPALRLGGEWRFEASAVLAWMRGSEPETSVTQSLHASPPPLVAANGDVCIELLLQVLGRSRTTPVGLVQADSTSGREHVRDGRVLAAGVHGTGTLAPDSLVKIHVTRRTICVASAKGRRLRSLRSLSGLRLATRAPTAGVRGHLSRALAADELDEKEVHARSVVCASHCDVALSLLSGQTDAGILTQAWAERAGLATFPIADEDYALCFRAEALEHEIGRTLVRTLQGPELKRLLGKIAGYAPRAIGTFV
jgi:excisionase family DNA binding protein